MTNAGPPEEPEAKKPWGWAPPPPERVRPTFAPPKRSRAPRVAALVVVAALVASGVVAVVHQRSHSTHRLRLANGSRATHGPIKPGQPEVLALSSPRTYPFSLVAGPDGNMWVTEYGTGRIVKVSGSGKITEFGAGLPANGGPRGIARMTTSGRVTSFHVGGAPYAITKGPDGNVWFTDFARDRVGKITPTGRATEYDFALDSHLFGITAGPDGNLWVSENSRSRIARVTPSGAITEYTGIHLSPHSITSGADGNLWFTEDNERIGRITTAGKITEFSTAGLPISHAGGHGYATAISSGPDGNLWVTLDDGSIARVTRNGAFTVFPATHSSPTGIAFGPGANIWVAAWYDGAVLKIAG